MVLSASPKNTTLIVHDLAQALSNALYGTNMEAAAETLDRYNKMFSTKPDIRCICKNCRNDGKDADGSTD